MDVPDTTILMGLDQQTIACLIPSGCSFSDTLRLKQGSDGYQDLFINPDLSITSTASLQLAQEDTVC
ncbi:MAG: hypothetical protein IPP71_23460 [Bacteroidetes bacterium]|nr:hypothetical protein [Bacteroidota bacterium]